MNLRIQRGFIARLALVQVAGLISGLLTAGPTPATVTLISSEMAPVFGHPVTLSAMIPPTAGLPPGSGNVTFFDGTTILGTRLLANGQAVLTTSLLPAGLQVLKAYYGGDSVYAASTSTGVIVTVKTVPGNGFAPGVNYSTGSGILQMWSVAMADFNGDGIADFVAVASYGGSISVLLGNGDGTYRSPINYAIDRPSAVAVADFNGDGKPDLAVITRGDLLSSTGTLNILLGNGDGTFQPASSYLTGVNPDCIAIGDLNGDGIADIASVDQEGVGVWLGNGDGTFQQETETFLFTTPASLAIGDFSGDGKADLAVVSVDALIILQGNGDGTFSLGARYSAAGGSGSVAVADFNGDGKPDLAVGGNSVTVLLGNGDGTFQISSAVPLAFHLSCPHFFRHNNQYAENHHDHGRDGVDLGVDAATGHGVDHHRQGLGIDAGDQAGDHVVVEGNDEGEQSRGDDSGQKIGEGHPEEDRPLVRAQIERGLFESRVHGAQP